MAAAVLRVSGVHNGESSGRTRDSGGKGVFGSCWTAVVSRRPQCGVPTNPHLSGKQALHGRLKVWASEWRAAIRASGGG